MKIKVIKYLSPSLLLLLLFTTEAYFKLVLFSIGEESILLQITKGLVLFCFSFYLLFKRSKQIWFIVALLSMFLIGQMALANGFYRPVLIAFVKFVFPIILLLFFSTYRFTNSQRHLLFRVFEYIILFNAFIIIIGFVFNISVFRTYLGDRFGFNGLFVTSAASSYIYSITLIFLFSKYKENLFKSIPNLIIILSIFLVGTKVCYLFLACFFLVYFLKYSVISKKIIISLFVTILFLGLYLFFFKYGIFNEIRERDGLISSVMSHRDRLFLEETIPYIQEHWGSLNYLFGGVSDLSTKSQIEFIDIFYFFGIIGGFCYYYIFLKEFLVFKMNIYLVILLSVLFILVLLGGNFFSYPSIFIYLVILQECLKLDESNQYT